MQAAMVMGIAFYLAIGVFDAVWAVFMADLGASQLFIGTSMSLFTLPMILIAPWAGRMAARNNAMNILTLTLSIALVSMFSYGWINSLWWLLVPLLIHATVDAISMPAMQLTVGYASGEEAFASGQGLYGATGLLVATVASFLSGYVYQTYGAQVLWLTTAVFMGLCIITSRLLGREAEWRPIT